MSWATKKFWSAYRGMAIAVVPKCGNTSFSALVGGTRLGIEEALQFDKRIMFVRDPIERVASGYSHYHDLNSHGPSRDDVPREVTHNGYERYVDFILSNENPHWMPQMQLTGGIATNLHKFNCDNIRKWWPMYWSGRQPDWLNACTHLPINDYRIDDLRAYYIEDARAYESAT